MARLSCLLLVAALLLGTHTACRSGGLERLGIPRDDYRDLPRSNARNGRARTQQARNQNSRTNRNQRTRRRKGKVNLSAHDLAPVDSYVHHRNSQWILGDTVDIYASKEYFSQVLTMNTHIGLVHRKDEKVGDQEIATLTFIGHETQRSAMTNPRVLIGTGITVSARRVLRLRMAPTSDANVPIRLRVVATGNASRGRDEEVAQRGPQLQIGGTMRNVRGRWVWTPVGG